MPDIKKEKLVALINDVLRYQPWGEVSSSTAKEIANELIANGVTIQEHDGCVYCKEDRDGFMGAFGAFSLYNPFHRDEWYIETGHCKKRQIYFCPMCGRKLSEPPKGE